MLDDVVLSPVVVGHLSGLNGSSSAGPDGLQPHMLRACSGALSLPLYLVFNRPLKESAFPTLVTSIVSPLFKRGNMCDP